MLVSALPVPHDGGAGLDRDFGRVVLPRLRVVVVRLHDGDMRSLGCAGVGDGPEQEGDAAQRDDQSTKGDEQRPANRPGCRAAFHCVVLLWKLGCVIRWSGLLIGGHVGGGRPTRTAVAVRMLMAMQSSAVTAVTKGWSAVESSTPGVGVWRLAGGTTAGAGRPVVPPAAVATGTSRELRMAVTSRRVAPLPSTPVVKTGSRPATNSRARAAAARRRATSASLRSRKRP